MFGLSSGLALADGHKRGEQVPSTIQGGGRKAKDGGESIGEGFRSISRDLKKVFTGKRSKEEFEDAAKIGTGARDVGGGAAGVGRGVGREIKEEVKGEDSSGTP